MKATGAVATAVFLLLATHAAVAADMCGGPCSFSIQFPEGGSVASPGGATITFGSGGVLSLGEGGSITLGEGGSITPAPAEGAAPDMSAGGSVVLGPAGSITFGPAGGLATGEQGAVSLATDSALDIASAGSVTVDAEAPVQMGNFHSDGEIHVTSNGDITLAETPAVPINVTLAAGDAAARIDVTTGGDYAMGSISGNGSVWLTTTNGEFNTEGGTIESGSGESGSSGGSDGGGSSGSITLTGNCGDCASYTLNESSGGGSITANGLEMVDWGGSASGGAGSADRLLVLVFGLIGALRRRRRA